MNNPWTKKSGTSLKQVMNKSWKRSEQVKSKHQQAGAELCQAQYRLELDKFWFGSVASLKFDCLLTTGEVAFVNNQI